MIVEFQDRELFVDYSTERMDETFHSALAVNIHKIEYNGRDITNRLSPSSIETIIDKIKNKL